MAKKPEIGDVILGHQVTEVRGSKVFGVEGLLSQEKIDELRSAQPGQFIFRPGYNFAVLKDGRLRLK